MLDNKLINTSRLALADVVTIHTSHKYNSNKIDIIKKKRLILLRKDYNEQNHYHHISKTSATDIEDDRLYFMIDSNDAKRCYSVNIWVDKYGTVLNNSEIKLNNLTCLTNLTLLKDLDLPKYMKYKTIRKLAVASNKEATKELSKKLVLNKKYIKRTKQSIK